VLYLPFDHDDGSYARDRSGYNNHGTIYGATLVNGKIGMGREYDGVDDYVEVPYMPQGQGWKLSAITLLGWFKPLSLTGDWNHVFEHGAWYALTINTAGEDWRYGMASDIISSGWVSTGIKPAMGTWYYVGLRWGVDDPVIRFFLNGVEVHSRSLSGSYIGTKADLFHVGHPIPYASNVVIDEFRLYTRLLSAAEIARLMNMRGV